MRLMNSVRYISLGGAGNVTQNMHVFETEEDIIILDVGIGFPDTEQLGVDVVIPDVSYLISRKNKIRAIVISHAHEDHIGGLPYVLNDLGNPPVYASKLAQGFIRGKLSEYSNLKHQSLVLIEPEKGSIRLGGFEIVPYRVNHSVPDALGFFIRTRIGNFVYSPDFKFDWTPVDNVLFDVGKIAKLAEEGVMALFSDSLGSTRDGFTESERIIEQAFENEMASAKGQVFITTMSSNISRMQQALNVSLKHGRRVVPVGRSIDQNIQIAANLGYLQIPDGSIVSIEDSRRMNPRKLTYIIAGSFGQKGSALDRLSRGENKQIRLREGAVVIFSADPIPGVADQVGSVIDNCINRGAKVVYSDIQDNLHVSGHGSKGDLAMMAGIVRPRYFVPIGGQTRHQRGYRDLVTKMGFDPRTVFEMRDNQTIVFDGNGARWGEPVEVREVFVDGGLIGDVGKVVLRERQQLAAEGVVVIIVKKQGDQLQPSVTVESRGFVFKSSSDEIISQVAGVASRVVGKRSVKDWNNIKDELDKKVGSLVYQKIKRRPLIVPVLVNL